MVIAEGTYEVYYYDAATGVRRPDYDRTSAGYLEHMAEVGDNHGEIAVAVRGDSPERSVMYLTPRSHEWTAEVPAVLRSSL